MIKEKMSIAGSENKIIFFIFVWDANLSETPLSVVLYSENSSNAFRRLRRRRPAPQNLSGFAAFGACPV
jgi:hypothetical protein